MRVVRVDCGPVLEDRFVRGAGASEDCDVGCVLEVTVMDGEVRFRVVWEGVECAAGVLGRGI